MESNLGFIEMVIALAFALLGGAMGYGLLRGRVSELGNDLISQKEAHDREIEILNENYRREMDALWERLTKHEEEGDRFREHFAEFRSDVRTLTSTVTDLKQEVTKFRDDLRKYNN